MGTIFTFSLYVCRDITAAYALMKILSSLIEQTEVTDGVNTPCIGVDCGSLYRHHGKAGQGGTAPTYSQGKMKWSTNTTF